MTKRLNVSFVGDAWSEYLWWQKNDRAGLKQVNKLISDTVRHPFKGLGKPEPLQYELSGYWSRRINHTDRMVYAVFSDRIEIIQLRYHYD